ncbi:DUF2975 domain-containing protein [Macrococcus hajekii]|uniref:DUF2975 domain-containing protein n=1 Tax=Macrococcus hajekii TaxID=198482 RepID=A0A4R6BIV7_9STAP|nr:DUF2975 domain-containing protein [Macrococcus hajekii]TDM01603.1 DUF2975 domain-containing protein [Macrococcus hajekii]GGB01398.1 hypothetical protein GCM10007190_06840 [Macrococcus hajekii]
MNQNEASKFRGLLKVLDVLYMIAVGLISFGFIVVLGITIYLSTQSEAAINQLLKAENTKLTFSIGNTSYQFANEYLQGHLAVDKNLLLIVLMVGLFNLALTLTIVWLARKLIKAFKQDQFFHKNNGNFIESIAWLVLVLGHTFQTMISLIGMLMMKGTNLDQFLLEHNVIASTKYQLLTFDWNTVLIAITIWFIGRAFKYGAFLQEEYDATV